MLNPGITVEKWDDITKYLVRAKCNICQSSEKVKVGVVPIYNCALTHSVFSGNHTNWSLCQKCHDEGWGTPKKYYYGFFYFNSETSKYQNSR